MANGHRTQIKRERNAQKDTRPSAKFDGPTMKRVRPRAQGRAYRILKRMSNLKIVLDEKKAEE